MSEAKQRERLLEDLGAVILSSESSESARRSAGRALSRLASDAMLQRLARSALFGDLPGAVEATLDLLEGRRSLQELESVLIGFLYDASAGVRQRALRLLGEKGSEGVLSSLDGVIASAKEGHSIFDEGDVAAAEEARRRIQERFQQTRARQRFDDTDQA